MRLQFSVDLVSLKLFILSILHEKKMFFDK